MFKPPDEKNSSLADAVTSVGHTAKQHKFLLTDAESLLRKIQRIQAVNERKQSQQEQE